MSLLTIIQDASLDMGLPSPASVIGSNDTRVLELLSMANRTGEELARRYDWQELTNEVVFTASGTISQGYAASIAVDFGRFVDQTFWDRSQRLPITGPATAQEWQSDLSFAIVAPPYKFIVQAGILKVGPTALPNTDTLVFNYITKYWCQSSAGAGQTAFAADTDTTKVPEELFKLELIWRWKSSKGLAYAEDLESAEEQIERYMGQSGGRRILFIGGQGVYYLSENVPAGDWPQVAP